MPSCWNSMAAGFSVLEQRRSFMVRIGKMANKLIAKKVQRNAIGIAPGQFAAQACNIKIDGLIQVETWNGHMAGVLWVTHG